MLESIYTKELIIDPSMCDATTALGHSNTFALFQDIASEHAQQIGVGGAAMSAQHIFWLTVHTRVQFFDKAYMMQPVTASTWPGLFKPNDRRCFRYYRLSQADRLIALGKTEWAIINTQTGRLCPISDSGFPTDFPYSDEIVCPEPLTRFLDCFTEADAIQKRIVRASDTDFGGHMNNVAYVRILLDSFSSKELAVMPIQEFEIHFSSPSYEGEILTLYRKETGTGWQFALKKADGKVSALASLVLTKR